MSKKEFEENRAEAEKKRKELTLEEKIWLMSGNLSVPDMRKGMQCFRGGVYYLGNTFTAGGLEMHGIPAIRLCDGSRGIIGKKGSTCFPVTICRGASFDKELERQIGIAIGEEVRDSGGNLFAGICLNLPYHPGWGRSQETYGENSFHIGEMGAALTEGIDEMDVIPCIKHFAFNSMEYARFKVNIECGIRTEREVYFPHFKKCIDHGAMSVMTSYNRYKNRWCGENPYLIRDVLKGEWGFDGFVLSDFLLGIRDTYEAASSGMDMEMCATYLYGEKLLEAVQNGTIPEAVIDEAADRIIRGALSYGKKPFGKVDYEKHKKLALQAAREGITLLKNEGILPLKKEKAKRLLVLGRLADKENVGDHGTEWVESDYVRTPIQGIVEAAGSTEVTYYDGKNLSHAQYLAKSADAVVLVVGYDEEDEGEYAGESIFEEFKDAQMEYPGDRRSLRLHVKEAELIKEVAEVNPNTIVVLIGGGTILLEDWADRVNAVMMAYYPGMEGGTAIAEILFGKVNPSGKLPFVIPKTENDLPKIDWDAEEQTYEYYHGYTKLEKEGKKPELPFGYGLSYTDFSVSNECFGKEEDQVFASCEIENVGKMDGAEVVQLYVGFLNSAVDRPRKVLRGFERIFLRKGERRQVKITCPIKELAWFNPEEKQMEIEHMQYELYIGTSSDEKDLLKGVVQL